MLVLTRKTGEALYIGDEVKVTIMDIKGNQVKIGIDADNRIRILREEIYHQILSENQEASDNNSWKEEPLNTSIDSVIKYMNSQKTSQIKNESILNNNNLNNKKERKNNTAVTMNKLANTTLLPIKNSDN